MDQIVCDHLKLDVRGADMTEVSYGRKVMNLKKQVHIALVGKYVELPDAISVVKRSSMQVMMEVKIDWIDANQVTAENAD